jgi:tetratricopeptide (TPR) repeat protein
MTTRRSGTMVATPGRIHRVAALGKEASGRLLAHALGARSVDPQLLAHVVSETAGNPLAIELVASELAGSGRVRVIDGTATGDGQPLSTALPKLTTRLVTARLAQLRPIDRSLVLAAAAFDGPVPSSLVASVEGLVGDSGASAFRRLFARALLAPHAEADKALPADFAAEPAGAWGGDVLSAVPSEIVVPGRMTRRAMLATLDTSERERLHTKIATVLERGERTARTIDWLAYHTARSSDRRRAPDYLSLAADALEARGEPARAAERLAEAIDVILADALDPEGDRVLALTVRAAPLAIRGDGERTAERVIAAARGSAGLRADRSGRAGLAAVEALVALARGRAKQAIDAVAREADGELPVIDRARLGVLEGRARLARGEVARAVTVLGEAIALAARAEDPVLEGRGHAHLADALARLERFDDAEHALGLALALAARSAHAELRFVSLAAMGNVREGLGDARGACARYREALEVASSVILDAEVAAIASRAAITALRAGLDAEAGQRAQQAIDVGRRRHLEAITALGAAAQATVAITSLPDPTYLAHIERAVEKLAALDAPVEHALALDLLVQAARALEDPTAIASALTRAHGAASRAEWPALGRSLGRV